MQPNKKERKKTTPVHFIVKLLESNIKEILKAAREKWYIAHRGTTIWHTFQCIWLYTEFSPETILIRRQWNNIFKVLKENLSCQFRILYPVKMSFTYKGKIKTFSCNRKLKEIHDKKCFKKKNKTSVGWKKSEMEWKLKSSRRNKEL